jgi:RNA polymerase sigma-70 factor (ECF subfamily)
MSGFSGVLPFPAAGSAGRAKNEPWIIGQAKKRPWFAACKPETNWRFAKSWERYQSKVFSIIHGVLRNRNDAEDIAQQVFAKVYFSISSFDFRSSLLTWLYKITVNECYDYLRKKRVRKLVYESDFHEEDARRMSNSEAASDTTRALTKIWRGATTP